MLCSFTDYTDELARLARETPGVEGLILLGSSSNAGASRRDIWSDHDFYAVLKPEYAASLRKSLAFIPFADRVTLIAAEGPIGFSIVYDDGHLFEFAAGTPSEIGELRLNRFEVAVDAAAVGQLIEGAVERAMKPGTESAHDATGLVLAKAFIGYGRAARGEVASGGTFVRSHAIRFLTQAVRARFEFAGADSLDPLRHFDVDFPVIAADMESAMQLPVTDAARALIALTRRHLEPGWPEFPSAAADVLQQRMKV